MFALGSSHIFYLYDGFCDMRKSFDGLCGLTSSVMQRQATSGEVFVFLNWSCYLWVETDLKNKELNLLTYGTSI